MSQYLLSAEAGFSAAHTLPGVDTCERLHGHNWRVRLTVRVGEDELDSLGMGPDFREIRSILLGIVQDFEHRHLNELEPFRDLPPTAERIAHIVAVRAARDLGTADAPGQVEEVSVWEMPEYCVVYRP